MVMSLSQQEVEHIAKLARLELGEEQKELYREQLSAILALENPDWKMYWVDPGDLRTQMQQEAYPGEDINDRPLPEVSIPGLLQLIEGYLPSGRYQAQKVAQMRPATEEGLQ